MLRRTLRKWRSLLHRVFTAWASFSEAASNKRLVAHRMRYWKAKTMIQAWNKHAVSSMNQRKLKPLVKEAFVRNKTRRYFLVWHETTCLRRSYGWKSKPLKDISLGVSIMNVTWLRLKARTMFCVWHEEVITDRVIDDTRWWRLKYCLRTHFTAWVCYVDSIRLEQNQNDHRRCVSETLQNMKEHDKRIESDTTPQKSSPQPSFKDSQDVYKLTVAKAERAFQRREREAAYQKEKNDLRLEWRMRWEQEENRRIIEVTERTTRWLTSKDGKNNITMYIKMMRQFPSTTPSPAVIALSLFDSKLGHQGLLADAFFEGLERITNSDTIHRSEFEEYLQECECRLSPSEINDICDGDGRGDTNVVNLSALKDALSESHACTGIEGSQWKKYIDPVHQMIVFHNVMENKVLRAPNRQTMKAIATDHFLHHDIIKERRNIYIERKMDLVALEQSINSKVPEF